MIEHLFILGAGASADAGAPLMNNFLDVAEDILMYKKSELGKYKDQFELVFKVLSCLQSTHSKSNLDLLNIESVFGILEMACIIKKLPGMKSDEIEEARNALVLLIVKTLELSIEFTLNENGLQPTNSYSVFARKIKEALRLHDNSVSIITFNYDIAFDYACYYEGINIDYGFGAPTNQRISLPLLKLHGSTNWTTDRNCSAIIPFSMSEFGYGTRDNPKVNAEVIRKLGPKKIHLNASDKLSSLHHNEKECNDVITGTPLIVPPTWNKTQYHGMLTNIWNRAAKELSEARNINVIGYSLPETDSFFRYLFALGTEGESRIRNFIVYDPKIDENGVEARFRNLLGKGVIDRFDPLKLDFAKALRQINIEKA